MARRRRTTTGEKIAEMVGAMITVWGAFAAFNWFGESQIEYAKQQQAKMQVDSARIHREAEAKNAQEKQYQIEQQAKIEAAKEQEIEQARKMEMARFKREIAEHQAQESKKAEFEKQFKPREECNDPMLEWSKTVQCNNEKMNAKEKFYNSH